MGFTLRPYQEVAINKGIEFIDSKIRNEWGVIVAPTAAGKSIIVSKLAEHAAKSDGHTLVIQPSAELLAQNFNKYLKETGDASAGIYSASAKQKTIGQNVTFCTPGTVKNIAGIFKQRKLSLVIIDECDYGVKKNSTIDKFIKESGCQSVIGLTATPFFMEKTFSGDTKPKMMNTSAKTRFSRILHIIQIEEMISNEYWAPIEYKIGKMDTSMLKFNSTRSEFTQESIKAFEVRNDIHDKMLNLVVYKCKNMKHILIFVESIESARRLEEFLKQEAKGISVISIDSNDDKKRQEGVRGFLSGKYRVCINVGILGVGFDFPELDCIIDMYPTNSLRVFYQRVGRGVRIHPPHLPKKERFVYVDMAGNFDRFGPVEHLWFGHMEYMGWTIQNRATNMILTDVNPKALAMYYERMGMKMIKPNRKKGETILDIGKWRGKGYTLKDVHEVDPSYYKWLLTATFDNKFMIDLQYAAKQYAAAESGEVILEPFDQGHPLARVM